MYVLQSPWMFQINENMKTILMYFMLSQVGTMRLEALMCSLKPVTVRHMQLVVFHT